MNISKSKKPYKVLCVSCNPKKFHDIKEKSLISNETFLKIHKDCDLQYFTLDEYKRAIDQSVTVNCHESHKKQQYSVKWLVNVVEKINRMGEDAQSSDFPQLTKENFRKLSERARKKGLIEYSSKGKTPTFVKKGFEISKNRKSVTFEGMGLGKKFEKLLRDARLEHPKMHDIRFYFTCESIYDVILSYNPTKVAKNTGGIHLPEYTLGDYVSSTVIVNRKSIEVSIKCSRNPLIVNQSGALQLIRHLEKIRSFLIAFSHCDNNDIPDILSWTVKSFHFNKDSHRPISMNMPFEYRVDEVTTGFIRFYSKVFPDGKKGTRLEVLRQPNKPVSQITDEMTRIGNYVAGNQDNSLTELEADNLIPIRLPTNTVEKVYVSYSPPQFFVI